MEVEFPYKLSGTQTDELGIRLGQRPYALIDSEGRGAVLNETQLREFAGALLQAADLLETAPANRRPTGDRTMPVNYTIYANGFSPGPVDHISFDEVKGSFRITSWTADGDIVSVFIADLHEVFDLAKAILPRHPRTA